MAFTKITDLTELTAPRGEDIIQIIDDPSGTPTNKKMTLNRVTDVINVINYGADKTGVADSTTAIEAAITAASATNAASEGGQTVFFPWRLFWP